MPWLVGGDHFGSQRSEERSKKNGVRFEWRLLKRNGALSPRSSVRAERGNPVMKPARSVGFEPRTLTP